MAGLFGLSASVSTNDFFRKTLFWGTFYNRHLGEEHTGLAAINGGVILSESKPGLFPANFKSIVDQFVGTEGLGYCGSEKGPFHVKKSKFGAFSICFTGNIINRQELVDEFDKSGHIFEEGNDIEVIAKLIVQGDNIVHGIKKMNEKVKGAYSLLLLSKEGIYAVRNPSGQWPLVIGITDSAVIVSSECGGFNNLGFEPHYDIQPGEIILLKDGAWKVADRIVGEARIEECSFYGAYTSSAAAIVHGIPVTSIREQLGARLAREDIKEGFIPHVVIGVPDSGEVHADGYKAEFDRQIILGKIDRVPFRKKYLFKYGFARSFLRPTPKDRRETAHYKIVVTAETIENFLEMLENAGLDVISQDIKSSGRIIIVVCDDSVVRGVQIKSNLVPKIRMIFEREIDGISIKAGIHIRASFPPLLSYCSFGKTTRKGEVLAHLHPMIKDRIKYLGVDSLKYNTVNDLIYILGRSRDELCLRCISE